MGVFRLIVPGRMACSRGMKHLKHRLVLLPIFFAAAATALHALEGTEGCYSYNDKETGHTMNVWYCKPAGFTPDTPVVITLHGAGRGAKSSLNTLAPYAKQMGFMLLAPEFSKKNFPTLDEYNYGNYHAAGRVNPKSQWSYTILERIFKDFVETRERTNARDYYLYGHSAGAQFAHRMALLLPEAKIKMVIAANAGTYAMPQFQARWPYGLGGTGVTEKELGRYLGIPMTILLGDKDNDPNHRALTRGAEVDEQGIHRFGRGTNFFNLGKATAEKLKVVFGWKYQIVPGAGHEGGKMAAAAARLVCDDMKLEKERRP